MEDLMKLAILSAACVLAFAAPALAQDDSKVLTPGNGVTAPRLINDVKPFYPPEVMRTGISGSVRMECVVRTDGTVGDIRVIEPLEPSLDAESVKALKEWKFSPGLRDGKAVPVMVEVEVSFSLLRGPRLGSPDVSTAGPGVTLPKVLHQANPEYTAEARVAGIQGTVVLDCVVLADGTVGDTRVSKHLDPDLDAQAIRTLRQWQFTPGEKDGRVVPVQVSVEMTFSLR
jgi:TonB family protein